MSTTTGKYDIRLTLPLFDSGMRQNDNHRAFIFNLIQVGLELQAVIFPKSAR